LGAIDIVIKFWGIFNDVYKSLYFYHAQYSKHLTLSALTEWLFANKYVNRSQHLNHIAFISLVLSLQCYSLCVWYYSGCCCCCPAVWLESNYYVHWRSSCKSYVKRKGQTTRLVLVSAAFLCECCSLCVQKRKTTSKMCRSVQKIIKLSKIQSVF